MNTSLTRWCQLLLLTLLLSTTNNQAFGALKLLPETIGAGGEVRLIGSDYLRDQSLSAMLRAESGAETLLEGFNADADGNFLIDVDIPTETEPGFYDIVIRTVTGLGVDEEPITIISPPHITLDPVSGIPGQAIDIHVSNLQPGTVRVLLDGVNVLGPTATSDGPFSGTFHVPLVDSRGESQIVVRNMTGRRILSETIAPFQISTPQVRQLTLENEQISSTRLIPGQRFEVSADVIVPDGFSLSDFDFTLVWITGDGQIIPINQQEVTVQDGRMAASAFPPSLSAGAVHGSLGEDDDLGFVYTTLGMSGNIRFGVEFEYDYFDLQSFTIQVLTLPGDQPIENAYVTINTNAQLVDPSQNDPEPDQLGGRGNGFVALSTYAGIYQGPHQVESARLQLIDEADDQPTSCPITLGHGPTDKDGEFHFELPPTQLALANKINQQLAGVDINLKVAELGLPEFSITVNALTEGYAPVNSQGKGTVFRFDMQYNWHENMWFLRDGPDGDFSIPFNPNAPLPVRMPGFDGEIEFPGQPFIEGLHSEAVLEDGVNVTHIQKMVTFPNTFIWPSSMFNAPPAVISMPFNELSFGVLADMKLYLNGEYVSDFERLFGDTCSGHDTLYLAEIPDAHRLSAGIHHGTIEAFLGGDQPISSQYALVTETGPTWFLDNSQYENQSVWWAADNVYIEAHEIPSDNDSSIDDVEHIGPMDNDNASSARVSESTGGAKAETSRNRYPDSDATVAGNEGGSDQGDSSIQFEVEVPFGDENNELTIVDTGKIPLFRYTWGADPIAGATLGADFWLRVFYRYWGQIKLTLQKGMLLDFTAAPAIQAGIDVFFELTALFGLISAKATASPQIGVELPIVIKNNLFNDEDSRPCFEFVLDVLIEAKIAFLKEDWEQNLLTLAEPSGCTVGASALAMIQSIRVEPPPDIHPTIAADGQGYAMAAWEHPDGIAFQDIQMGVSGPPKLLVSERAGFKPALASPAPNTWLLVWSQNALDDAVVATMDLVDALPNQHMVWALHDGNDWSDIMNLTLPTTGEGAPVLATCPAGNPDCPAGGEVLAVWERDVAGDYTQHEVRLYFARYSGLTESWGAIQAVDPGSTAKELGATATYVHGEPVIMWVRNDALVQNGDSVEINLNENHLAYRWLDQAAGVQIPVDLPASVANPSIDVLSDGTLVASYTVSTEGEAFIGNKRALHTARGTCANGICTWNGGERRTSDDRRIFAERPKTVIDDQDNISVTFRHFGYNTFRERDPLSIKMMTGDVSQITFEFENLVTDVRYVTQDGAVNWRQTTVFDPGTGNQMILGVNSPLTQPQIRQLGLPDDALSKTVPGVTSTRLGGSNGPVLHAVTQLPELEMIEARISHMPDASGNPGLIGVSVRNNGIAIPPDTPVTIAAAWNAPPGAGPQAGITQILIDEVGLPFNVEMALNPPPDYHEDAPNQLFVSVNPEQAIVESDGSNNTLVLLTGALPVPQNLTSTNTSDSPLIYIHWDPVDDPRVTGYRIYRINPDGLRIHVGTSDVAGFMDMSARPGHLYEYQVTAMSARAMESELSKPIHALAQSNEYDPDFGLLFRDRFESP